MCYWFEKNANFLLYYFETFFKKLRWTRPNIWRFFEIYCLLYIKSKSLTLLICLSIHNIIQKRYKNGSFPQNFLFCPIWYSILIHGYLYIYVIMWLVFETLNWVCRNLLVGNWWQYLHIHIVFRFDSTTYMELNDV